MRSYFIILLIALPLLYCKEQIKKEEQLKTQHTEKSVGTNPRVNTIVNKQYNSKGELVKFDSTFSYFYSSGGHDSSKVAVDKVFKEFKSYYKKNLMVDFEKQFDEIFLADSLIRYDFLNNDYFRKRFELNKDKMTYLFNGLDSLKIKYVKSIQPKKKTKN